MAIDLSNLIFTNKADIVPPYGTEEITNTGIANTLNGDDIINGIGVNIVPVPPFGTATVGINNYSGSTLDTSNGNDILSGSGFVGIYNAGTINTSNGCDNIIGIGDSGIVIVQGLMKESGFQA